MTLEELDEAWKVLTEREKTIITLRFGLENGTKPETLRAIGKRLGVTNEIIRQQQNIALSKLRRAGHQLETYGEIQPSLLERAIPKPVPKPVVKRKKKFVLPKLKKPPRAPYKTDKERLDWLESEIRVRSLYIDWSDIRGWQLRKANRTVSADDLRELIDEAIATVQEK